MGTQPWPTGDGWFFGVRDGRVCHWLGCGRPVEHGRPCMEPNHDHIIFPRFTSAASGSICVKGIPCSCTELREDTWDAFFIFVIHHGFLEMGGGINSQLVDS